MPNLFKRLFKRREKPFPSSEAESRTEKATTVDQGVLYFYVIIGSQVLFVFGLLAVIMGIGQVIATPWWVFLFAFFLAVGGCIYIYRKVKTQFRKFRDAFQKVNVSDRDYEISVMGGFLTMRVGQNPQRLLEAPPAPPVLDTETVETHVSSQR